MDPLEIKTQKGRWTQEELLYLVKWWGFKGTKKIAENLERTKNAVIGQAHRLNLRSLPRSAPLPEPEPEDPPIETIHTPAISYEATPNQCEAPDCKWSKQPGRSYCATHHTQLVVSRQTRVNTSSSFSIHGGSSIS